MAFFQTVKIAFVKRVAHVEMYAKRIPRALVRRLPGRNHQLNDDLTEVANDIKQLR